MTKLRFDALISFIDNLPFRKARVKGLGKETTVHVIFPYGLTGHPKNGELLLSWNVSGQESNRASIVDDPHLINVEPGEVGVYNPATLSKIIFKANGDIDITTAQDMTLNAKNLTINANVNIVGTTLTHNGTNIGDSHIHSQGSDSNGDSEVDTGTPHS